MKKILILILTLNLFINSIHAQAPNPPDKICFNYDVAGNRIAQIPSWIDHYDASGNPVYIPDCTPTENSISTFNYIIRVKTMSDLEYVNSFFTNISWILNISDVPIGISSGPVGTPRDPWIVSNPNTPIGVIIDLDPVFKSVGTKKEEELDAYIVPNPNDGQFELVQKGFDIETTEIYIIDNKGGVLFKRDFVNGQINISEYASGTYLLIIKDTLHSKTVRFIRK